MPYPQLSLGNLQVSPLASYQLQQPELKVPAAEPPNLGNWSQQLKEPEFKPTNWSGADKMGQLGMLSAFGQLGSSLFGGGGHGHDMSGMQSLMSQNNAQLNERTQQAGQIDPQMLQRVSRSAAKKPGMYGGFYPSVE